ncbi:hypothetical protein VNO80_25412 [Phaseolus coccineus]|uniref:Uncharacterized protein n=1 Tax=Phaseolus coccineus TaxID=3886 RepID=A0AAN9LZF8_PHACN
MTSLALSTASSASYHTVSFLALHVSSGHVASRAASRDDACATIGAGCRPLSRYSTPPAHTSSCPNPRCTTASRAPSPVALRHWSRLNPLRGITGSAPFSHSPKPPLSRHCHHAQSVATVSLTGQLLPLPSALLPVSRLHLIVVP